MYCTTTTTREKALKAVAAAERAMKRHTCCKSQYKFKCFSCGEMINRGDKITKCTTATNDGMDLRFRGADSRNGITFEETAFYQAETGTRTWVHIGCNPCFWNRAQGCLMSVWTDWGAKISHEFLNWCDSLPAHVFRSSPLFCQMKGYPQQKPMKTRIIRAVTRFQAIWRGYLYKKAYPIALQQHYEQLDIAREHRFAQYQEVLKTAPEVGDHVEILFNAKALSESIYSADVIEVQYRGCEDIKIKVKYHYDGEVRKYTGKKFKLLKKECEEHKRRLGIEAKLTGRLNTARIGLMNAVRCQTRPSIQDWRYHYPDGTPVE